MSDQQQKHIPERTDTGRPFKPVLTPKQAKRANSSAIGMLIAVAATFGLVLTVYFLNPTHRAETYQRDIDVQTVSSQAQDAAGYTPLAPELPEGWTSNFARWNAGTSEGVPYWEVGYLTDAQEFIGLTQTDSANPTWLSQRLQEAQISGQRTIDGVDWQLLDSPNGDAVLTAELDGFTVILRGTADLAEFDVLASAAATQLDAG